MTAVPASALAGGIPRLIHRIWLGGAVPMDVAERGHVWAERNPGWEVRTWRDWELPALRNQFWFDQASTPALRADIARLEMLHRFGGVYVDTDVEPLRPIEPLIEDVGCFLASEDDQWLGTAVIGAVPRHPFITALIDGVGASIATQPNEPPNVVTGPKYVTRLYHERRNREAADVTVFPPALFYPYHFSEPERRHGPFPDAYAVHHWSQSWVS
jgi:mannosyltransferase OCH1-like enzyme